MNGLGDEQVTMSEQLVVLMMTDVEGSSQHWLRNPQLMPAALDLLDLCVEQAVSPFGGEVVKSRGEGDSHFVVFSRASTAVRAAAALQRSLSEAVWPGHVGLRVRVGIHAGEVRRRNDDFYGTAVNYTARLRSTAHGGQVVVSRVIFELARDGLDGELRFEELGRHRIRDVRGWTEIFQLCGPFLMRNFPALVTLDKGLPPITTIVFLDAVAMSKTSDRLSAEGERALFGELTGVIAKTFSDRGGQYLKQLGDGCMALFADPDDAIGFTRDARSRASDLGIALRSVVHLGRVDFAHDEPVGRPLRVAATLLRRATPECIALSRAAAAIISEADDLITLD
jgi:class 3 adenylate cyclase